MTTTTINRRVTSLTSVTQEKNDTERKPCKRPCGPSQCCIIVPPVSRCSSCVPRTEGLPERMRGSWVGALQSWCHPLSKSGGTLPLQSDATQPLRLTARMAEVATAHLLLQDSTRETSTDKRKKREEKEGAHRQGQGWVGETCASALTRRSGLPAHWPLGSGTGSCLLVPDRHNSWCSNPSTTGKAQFITTCPESCHN